MLTELKETFKNAKNIYEQTKKDIHTSGLNIGIDFKSDLGHIDDFHPITEDQLLTIVRLINDPLPYNKYATHHNISNRWAPYRILRLLEDLNLSLVEKGVCESIKRQLSKEIFFKKLISEESGFNNTQYKSSNFPEKINNILSYIRDKNNNFKIGIIEDELNHGWNHAYRALFGENQTSIYDPIDDVLADAKRKENFDKFLTALSQRDINLSCYDIILLDLRLWEQTKKESAEILDIRNLSGMKVLNLIRTQYPTLPVIICSASNKSWSYEEAIDLGANGYWSKESPEYGVDLRYNLSNTMNLVKLVESCVRWATDIKEIYNSIDQFIKYAEEKDCLVANNIEKKKKIIVGQLHNKKSNYLKKYYGQSGNELAFLILWSLLNDITRLMIEKKSVDGEIVYYTIINNKEIQYCKKIDGKYILTDNHEKTPQKIFPDICFPNFYLYKLNYDTRDFNNLRNIRNKLDFIHGGGVVSDGKVNVEIEHLKKITNIYHYMIFKKENPNLY